MDKKPASKQAVDYIGQLRTKLNMVRAMFEKEKAALDEYTSRDAYIAKQMATLQGYQTLVASYEQAVMEFTKTFGIVEENGQFYTENG